MMVNSVVAIQLGEVQDELDGLRKKVFAVQSKVGKALANANELYDFMGSVLDEVQKVHIDGCESVVKGIVIGNCCQKSDEYFSKTVGMKELVIDKGKLVDEVRELKKDVSDLMNQNTLLQGEAEGYRAANAELKRKGDEYRKSRDMQCLRADKAEKREVEAVNDRCDVMEEVRQLKADNKNLQGALDRLYKQRTEAELKVIELERKLREFHELARRMVDVGEGKGNGETS
jgi:regulator of replication initiation timing